VTGSPTPLTPAQTVGPFLSLGLAWPDGHRVVDPDTAGAIRIGGRVFDGNGDPVGDGMIETWQLGPGEFRGFGRCLTDPDGGWQIVTLKPAHVDVLVFARGLLHRLVTRIYFADEEAANAADPVLAGLPDEAARATLLATPADGGYRFDIHLQGDDETVFFAL
jgi:protocatechuate 3,4-dioxygenase, alpha subunit